MPYDRRHRSARGQHCALSSSTWRSPPPSALEPLIFEAFDAGDVGASLDAVDFATCAGAAALILLRRRAPLPVLVVAVIAAVWSLIPDDDQGVLPVAAILALYTVASTSSRRTAWTAGAATAAALYLTAAITSAGPWYDGENLELIAWTVCRHSGRRRSAEQAGIQPGKAGESDSA